MLVGRPTVNGWQEPGAVVKMSDDRARQAFLDGMAEPITEIETHEAAPAPQHAVLRKGRAKPRRKRLAGGGG